MHSQTFILIAFGVLAVVLAAPGGYHHKHHIIHVPYHVHTVHHHHTKKIAYPVHHVEKVVEKVHVPVEKIVEVPKPYPVYIPIHNAEHHEEKWY